MLDKLSNTLIISALLNKNDEHVGAINNVAQSDYSLIEIYSVFEEKVVN